MSKEKVIIRFVPDYTRFDPKHLLGGGMHPGSFITLMPRKIGNRFEPIIEVDEKGNVTEVDFLTEAELELLKKDGIDVTKPDKAMYLVLGTKDVILNLNNPYDLIKYKTALQYDKCISRKWEDRDKLLSYRKWSIVKEGEEAKIASDKMTNKTKAYMLFGKYGNDMKILSYLYWKLEGKFMSMDLKPDDVIGWFEIPLEQKASTFVRIAEDKDLLEKVLIFHAMKNLVIQKQENDIFYYGDVALTTNPLVGDFEEAAKFLKITKNQTIKLEIEAKTFNQ